MCLSLEINNTVKQNKIMAHRIGEYDKQQGIEQAWHGLTEVVPAISLEDNWLTKWDVAPVVLEKRGKPSRHSVLEATDIPDLEIGKAYVADTFKPVDNKAFLELVRASISGTAHTVVSVGSVRNRGRVFLSIKLNGMETFEAAGRKFSAFLNFGNGHDKSSVLWVNTSNICTVCDNTFTCNLFSVENKDKAGIQGDDVSVAKRHTKNVVMRLPDLANLIDKAVGVQGEFQATFERMNTLAVSVPTAKSLFAGFVGRKVADLDKGLSTRASNTVDRLVSLFETGKGNMGINRADAFSASTDYYTHESSGNSDNPWKQVVSSEFGAGNDAKAEFWGVLTSDEDAAFEKTVKRGESLLAHTV